MERADALKLDGNDHYKKHNFKQAIALYTKAAALQPRSPVRTSACSGSIQHALTEDSKTRSTCQICLRRRYANGSMRALSPS